MRDAGRLGRLSPRRRGLLAAVLGAVAALGQAPLGLWPATLGAFAILFALFQLTQDWRQAGRLGWVAGTGYFLVALSWIVEPFLVDVARHGWMAPFALVIMSGGLALFWAVGYGIARLAGVGGVGWIAALVLAEAVRGYLFSGFPWAQPGHVWVDTPLLQWASVFGALGLCAVTLGGAIALRQLAAGRHGVGVAGVAGLLVLYLSGPLLVPPAVQGADAPAIRLVQPNAEQHLKWHPDHVQEFLDRQIAYTRADTDNNRPDLIVWPETAIPAPLHRADPTLAAISAAADGVPVVLGVRRIDGARLFNSLVLLDEQGQRAALYDKHHLVPFGEYIPFGDQLGRFGLRGLAAQDGNGYSSGAGPRLIDMGDLGRALPLICYEGVFPRNVAGAAGRADFMLLITNDAWFGQVSGPYQHLAQARLRTVEQGLPMIRVANTGVSAVIDAGGRVVASLPLGQAGWVDAPLPPPQPPTLYARMGDWPIWAGLVLAWLAAVLAGHRRR